MISLLKFFIKTFIFNIRNKLIDIKNTIKLYFYKATFLLSLLQFLVYFKIYLL